ncbi:gamma-glutamylcyclotransferase [Skermanella pratensis]|uniref:gamma-glutamylcyclotransferase n=1 Tax=Skermanella pratensis TaxID=2233999 RepID=UPI001FE50AA9|nr:gamma-glutamylcyclotransferase [Skermanella pratensis]
MSAEDSFRGAVAEDASETRDSPMLEPAACSGEPLMVFASPAARSFPKIMVPPDTDLWVFGYGSLMWNPEFPFVERRQALLRGYHRRFCVYSHRYRGTPDRPGLVLGLDRGGSCRGMVFRVEAGLVDRTLDYLWDREMVSGVYRPKLLGVWTEAGTVSACTFVADRGHRQYCGEMCVSDVIRHIRQGVGERGPNLEYLANTVGHLRELGMVDRGLERLLTDVQGLMERGADNP